MAKTRSRIVWTLTLVLVLIGLSAAGRRTYVRFAAGAALDTGFAGHAKLTLTHILPAAVFFVLMPIQFLPSVRRNHPRWHRWSGRLLIALGAVIGATALVMSYVTPVGGANESAATTLFAVLFLMSLAIGLQKARQRRFAEHRRWMLRAFGVSLGIATTRPIVGAFFAAGKLSPHEFFGIAFWLGFSLTLLATETYLHTVET